ncbi:hypothetical protein V8F33_007461 [Rhypophila sp. PSN 637]
MSFNNTTLASLCSPSRAYNVTVFSANPNGPKRGIRRKLTAKSRAKVNAVRRTGACLSCRMLKVPCDIPDPENPGPCKRCLAIASRPQQKGLLAFRECIRTKIRDVNIFEHSLDIDFTSLNAPKLKSLLSKTVDPDECGPSLSLPEILSNIFTWMVPERSVGPERSIVGALICSEQFRQLHKDGGFMGGDLLEKFRVMIYSSTLAYVYDSGSREVYDSDLTMRDLHRITYAMGSDLLLYLDNALVPHQLAKMSQAQLSGLFVVIFGISLAVTYSTAVYDSPTFGAGTDTGGQTPKTLWHALQQHLSQMLAHHLVILGARLGLVLRGDSEKEVICSLMTGIIRRGNFVWVAQQRAVDSVESPAPSNISTSSSPSGRSDLAETTENTEELFVLNIPEADTKSDPTTGALGLKKLDSYRSTPVNVRSLQTIQNSLRAIVTDEDDQDPNETSGRSPQRVSASNGNTSPEESQEARRQARFFANKRASEAFRYRKSQRASTPAQVSNTAKDATSTIMPMASSNTTSGAESGSSNNHDDTSSTNATSSTPASPFYPLSTDLDLDMDLDADPFGIGWLPDPEPQLETELEAPVSASDSHSESTLESGSPKDQGTASQSDSHCLSIPNCLQRGWSRPPSSTWPIAQSPPTTRPDPGYEPSPPRANTSPTSNNNNYIQSTPSGWFAQEQVPTVPSPNLPPPAPSIWDVQNIGIPPSLQPPTNTTSSSSTTGGKDPYMWGVQSAPRIPTQFQNPSSNTARQTDSNTYPPNVSTDHKAPVWACQQQFLLPPRQQPTNSSSGGNTDSFPLVRSVWASQQQQQRRQQAMRSQAIRCNSPDGPPTTWASQQVALPPRRTSPNSNDTSTSFEAPSIWGSQQAVYIPPPEPPQTNSRADTSTSNNNSAPIPTNHIWGSQQGWQSQPTYSYPPPPPPPRATATTGSEDESDFGRNREKKWPGERFIPSPQRFAAYRYPNENTSIPNLSLDNDTNGGEGNSAKFSNSSYFGPVKKRPVI